EPDNDRDEGVGPALDCVELAGLADVGRSAHGRLLHDLSQHPANEEAQGKVQDDNDYGDSDDVGGVIVEPGPPFLAAGRVKEERQHHDSAAVSPAMFWRSRLSPAVSNATVTSTSSSRSRALTTVPRPNLGCITR